MRFVLLIATAVLVITGAAFSAPWIIKDAGLQNPQFGRTYYDGGVLNGKTDISGDPGTRLGITLTGSGWKKIGISDNYPIIAETGNGTGAGFGNLTGYSSYVMTVRNPNSTGWFNAKIYITTHSYGEWHASADQWIAPGQTACFVLDLNPAWGLNEVSQIGIEVASNVGTTNNYDMPSGQAFNVDVLGNFLTLNVAPESLYVMPGETVQLSMDVSDLAQRVNSCQAFLGYSNYYLFAESGCVAPGGGAWDQLIYNSWDVSAGVPGAIDTAIGVNASGAIGTQEDGTVASIQLVARDKDGVTQVLFRPDLSPDPFLTGTTLLGDMSGMPVFPNKANSQNIVIDGTPAALDIATAQQGGVELLTSLGSTTPAVQGVINVQVTASDLNGLPAAPALNAYDSALVPLPAVFVNQSPSGTFNYTVTIPATAANGLAQIRVSIYDRAGNRTDDLDHFNIDKNQITGQVEMEAYTGVARTVTFTATGGASTKTWSIPLTGWVTGKTSYTLTNVPSGTTGLSAKTAWSLRQKLSISLVDGQAVANFTDADKLLGGDLNNSNSVNIQDYSIMKQYWLTSNPIADITGDGVVNAFDYNKMIQNWFKVGDAQ